MQFQQDVLGLGMLRLHREGLLGQLQRGFGITLGQLLPQQAAQADKARRLRCQAGILYASVARAPSPAASAACATSSVVSSGRSRYFSARRARIKASRTFPRSQRHERLVQRLIAFAFAVAVEIARNRRFIAIQKPQHRHQQPDQFQNQPQHNHYQHQQQRLPESARG